MTTPYWGSLPKSSSDSRQPASRQPPTAMDPSGSSQPQQRSNRTSVQTTRTTNTEAATESTMSPFVSPTASSFAGQGLAPRPPSYPYDAGQHADFAERRQRRRSRKNEELDPRADAPTPPVAPDVPKAPPSSYRDPYAGAAPGHGPPRGARQGNPDDYYHQEAQQARRRSSQGPTVTLNGPESTDPASAQPKKASVARRVSTNDRSPLQKLEVRLDTLSKEEKRARAEAAERKARERAANTNPDLLQPPGNPPRQRAQPPPSQNPPVQSAQQQVRFTERRPSFEEGDDSGRRGVIAPQTAAVQRTTSRGQRGQPAQAPLNNDRRYFSEPQQQPRTTGGAAPLPEHDQGVPQRNLSFRERAVKNDLKLPVANSVAFSDDSPQATPPVSTAAPTKSGFSLTRSGSNKLRKEPPGDPWYSRRMEMEKKHGQIDSPNNSMGNTTAVVGGASAVPQRSTSFRDKPLPAEPHTRANDTRSGEPYQEDPSRGHIPSKAAKVMGFGGVQRRATAPTSRSNSYDEYNEPRRQNQHQQQQQSRNLGPVAGGVAAAAAVQAATRPDPKTQQRPDDYSSDEEEPIPDRGSHMVYARKGEQIGPGRGLYLPPQYLEEWKKASIGLLSGDLLDLSDTPAPQQDNSTPWWEAGGSRRRSSAASRPHEGEFDGAADAPTQFKPALSLKCGPLLRYSGIRQDKANARTRIPADRDVWRGSVMIVTQDSESSYDIIPTLRLFAQPLELLPPPPQEISGDKQLPPEYVDPIAGLPKLGRRGETLYVRPVEHLEEAKDLSKNETDDGLFERVRSSAEYNGRQTTGERPGSFAGRRMRSPIDGEKLSKYKDVRGFRLHAERGYTFWRFNIEVELGERQQRIAYRINRGPAMGFWVPARNQSMNIMFHSCNGFSMSVNPDELSGPDPMWRDVLNTHQTQPFHVMLGGGDQVYNDCLIGQSKLFNEWLEIRNPFHKRKALFTPTMQDELETLYLERYCMWFSQGLFGLANSQIPMVNMWDDHDISDGYGSYPHLEQNCPAFSGLGSVAFKYYMLFQHQSLPTETEDDEPSWLLSQKPGPYIRELSRSLYMSMGAKVSLLAVDARTERTEVDVIAEDTWKLIMDRCYDEIKAGTTEHLLVLLGVPIAYPRLVWLENILTSRLMDPVKAMGKLGFLGNALNKIDGGVEVMDDLNDHWTARNHKKERSYVIEDLQDLAADKSVRITILSGDVHLAAVGQFYANPKLGLPKHKDFRYMPNVISSAIANTPPPNLLADVLNKRNKIHHFDDNTEESMIPLFHQGVDGKARNNKHLLPHRNWCSIRTWTPGTTPPPTPPIPGYDGAQSAPVNQKQGGGIMRRLSKRRPDTSRPDTSRPEPNRGRDSRPPVSGEGKFGGLIRRLSSRRRQDPEDPQRPPPPPLTRTMSLNRADFGPRNFFSRKASKGRANDGGINGNWGGSESGDEEEYYDAYDEPRSPPTPPHDGRMRLRGGSGRPPYEEFTPGDEDYFTTRAPPRAPQQRQPQKQLQQGYQDTPPEPPAPIIKPFHRTPTGLSVKQLKKGGDKFNVDLEGGLDITLNVEVNPRDPAGITVPYRLLVPRLFWDDATESAALQQPAPSGFKRFLSFRKKQTSPHGHGEEPHHEPSHPVPAKQEGAGGSEAWDESPGEVPDTWAPRHQLPPQQQQQWQPAAQQQRQPVAQQQQQHQQHARQQSLSTRAPETQARSQPHHAPPRYQQPQNSAPYPQKQAAQAAPPAGRDTRYYDDEDYDSAEDDAQYQTYGRR